MPSLDGHGKLGAATIAFYIPLVILTFYLATKHGFKRDAGWILLLVFSIVRVVGGALIIAAELITPTNLNVYIGAIVLESIGLSPLLLATLKFVQVVGQGSFGERMNVKRIFRLLALIAIIALILTIVGGSDASSSSASTAQTGKTLRRAGVLLYLALYVLLAVVHLLGWLHADEILLHRRHLLLAISCALPFLGVRVVYGVLSVFGSNGYGPSQNPSEPSLSRFNLVSGSWAIYLVMGLIMEYLVVISYVVAGTVIPLQQEVEYMQGETQSDKYELEPRARV